MTRVLTVRIAPDLLGKAEARAASLGVDRAKYVRGLIEEDLAAGSGKGPYRFASEDLIGSVPLGQGPYTNARIRAKIRARLKAKGEKNR